MELGTAAPGPLRILPERLPMFPSRAPAILALTLLLLVAVAGRAAAGELPHLDVVPAPSPTVVVSDWPAGDALPKPGDGLQLQRSQELPWPQPDHDASRGGLSPVPAADDPVPPGAPWPFRATQTV